MKSVIPTFAIIICIALMAGTATASSNPGLYVPTFENNQLTSLHLSAGEKYWTWEENSGPDEVDIIQKMFAVGFNWEHNVTYGFYHLRVGWVGFGEMENEETGDTSDFWEDYQDWGVYLGMGYIYTASIPMQPENPRGFNIFWGAGFDLNGLIVAASTSSAEYVFYYAEAALIGTIGFDIPEIGLTAYLLVTGNILLGWEYRIDPNSGSAVDFSDTMDMVIGPFGVEIGACYTIPSDPQFRFGLSVSFVNQFMVNFHIGYSFRGYKKIIVHN